jgi:hypothetical protein
MNDTFIAFYSRPADEAAEGFAQRLHDAAAGIAADAGASVVVLLVDDAATGAPPEATAMPSQFDAALIAGGVSASAFPASDAAYAVSRRVIKQRPRGPDGSRSEGFTIVCPSVRASFLTHDEFDAHWRDNHSRIHVASSPGTCHYEQLTIDEALNPNAPSWDGVGLLSFASAHDYIERLFDGPQGQQAIFDDIARFLELERGETLPASEFVYRDAG